MLNPFISLSPAEISLVRHKARERFTQDRRVGARDLLQGDNARKQAYEELGVAGEMAFSRWLGIPMDPTETLRPGSPDVVIKGVRLDVKTSDRPNGDLKIPMACRPERADLYVLVSGSMQGKVFEIVGFIPSKTAFMGRYVTDLGRGPVRVIPRTDLYPVSQLPQAIRQFSQRTKLRTTIQPGSVSPMKIYTEKR
jgi:hypothetical protein